MLPCSLLIFKILIFISLSTLKQFYIFYPVIPIYGKSVMGLILLFIVSTESHCHGLIFTCLIILDIVPMQPGAPWSSTRKPALKLHLSREDLLFLLPCELQVNFLA